MRRDRLGYQLALLAIVCTLGIFLFPVANGPYPSVHGPASALRAMRAWMLLLAALTFVRASNTRIAMARFWIDPACSPAFRDLSPPPLLSVLRC